jgi:DNA-binding NtrC family response regulator
MKAYLYLDSKPTRRREVDQYFLLGSDETCHWVIPGASPRHAKIEFHGDRYILKDLRSSTGTSLNDQPIQEAPLSEGDYLQINDLDICFSLKEKFEKTKFLLESKNECWNASLQRMAPAARTPYPVLILGPSGTGKEVIANAIHRSSLRGDKAFVSVNCSALTESLIESELFGHIKGSFTGAVSDRKGAFEAARGGTLFLDEIGDLPLNLQAKLLRALENNEIRPVGSDTNIQTDVRILAATHQNLVEKIKAGQFRADLYYRLNVIAIETPNLFDRMEDFEDLLYGFAKTMKVRFAFSAIERMKKHSWPGNIRELKNTVARASALFPRETIEVKQVESILDRLALGADSKAAVPAPQVPLTMIKEMERQLILKKLVANKGNQRLTASELGIPKSTLHDRLRSYNIDPKTYAASFANS